MLRPEASASTRGACSSCRCASAGFTPSRGARLGAPAPLAIGQHEILSRRAARKTGTHRIRIHRAHQKRHAERDTLSSSTTRSTKSWWSRYHDARGHPRRDDSLTGRNRAHVRLDTPMSTATVTSKGQITTPAKVGGAARARACARLPRGRRNLAAGATHHAVRRWACRQHDVLAGGRAARASPSSTCGETDGRYRGHRRVRGTRRSVDLRAPSPGRHRFIAHDSGRERQDALLQGSERNRAETGRGGSVSRQYLRGRGPTAHAGRGRRRAVARAVRRIHHSPAPADSAVAG